MEEINKIYLDQEGYQKMLDSVEVLKKRILENNSGRREAFDAGAGDGWDSPEFEEIERTERLLQGELARLLEQLNRVEIIDKHNVTDSIDIGDVFEVDFIYSPNDVEEMTLKLISTSSDMNSEYTEVTLNSPLGKAIYRKKVGEKSSYSANGHTIEVLIKRKLELEDTPKSGR